MARERSPTKRAKSPASASQSPVKAPKKDKREIVPPGADIRNFFSQGGSQPPAKAPNASIVKSKASGSNTQPISIDDSDEEAIPSKTTTSKHFTKPSKSLPATSSSSKAPVVVDDTPSPAPPPKAGGKSKSKMPYKHKLDDSDDDEPVKPAAKRQSIVGKRASAAQASYVDDSDEDEVMPKTKQRAGKAKAEADFMELDDDDDEDDFDEEDSDDGGPKKTKGKLSKSTPKKAAAGGSGRSTPAKKASATASAKSTPKGKVTSGMPKKEPKKEVKKVDDDDVNMEPEEKVEKKPAPNWRALQTARAAGPKNIGGKEIPEGAPDCLAGLTFVFTGELDSLGRDEAGELVKRYSGRVTGAPSKKTSYVVVGENAGDSKLKKIKELGLGQLNEDEFLDLIRTRKGAELSEQDVKKQEKEAKKIAEQAEAMAKREAEEEKERRRKEKALVGTGIAVKKSIPLTSQLWTTKYAPTSFKEMCGNKAPVERLEQWLVDWEKSYKSGFKKPGKDGIGIFRAVLISGPPGIGKTTAAHLAAKQAGYQPLELNASDARSKKLIENSTNIDNTSLDGFFSGGGMQSTTVIDGVKIGHKTCLIMDEVDGMSAGDRGGVGALNGLIKKTKIPMILICNDRTLQKMKPLHSTTFNMTFRRPQPAEVRSRLMTILYKEKMKIPANVVDELVKGVNSDLRQVLNMLSTYKLGKHVEMDFDQGKELVRVNEKNTIMTPFTITDKLTNPYAFSRTNRESLNEKTELYFQDFSFVPLFIQEHYLKTLPANANQYEGPEKILKSLELVSQAANSISDGDLIDRMIHGSEQHWSLLPLHAFASTVRPAFHIYGPMRPTGGGGFGSWGPSFPQWLGQNSKQTKLQRQLTDIQIRMRLRVSGSRQEIREQYMPMLANKIVSPLVKDGSDGIENVIEYMDEYYLGKDDWDAFVELGVDSMKDDLILKKIPTATKTAFTRQYNKSDHPIAFHKGDMFASAKRRIADIGPAPDNEEVFEEDEEPAEEENADDKEEEAEEEGVNDVSKDKLIKAVKPKGKGKTAEDPAGGKKGKRK